MINQHRLATLLLAAMLGIAASCGGGGGGTNNPAPSPPAPPPPPPPPPPPTAEFQKEGLDGRTISHIYLHGDRLLATTDNGLYGKSVGQNDWPSLGLDGFKVQDLSIIDEHHWLAAVFPVASPFANPSLYETVNGGSNWLAVANDFGTGTTQSEPIWALLYDEASRRLYATGNNALASADDLGRTWTLREGIWDTAGVMDGLNFNSQTGHFWLGGQNSIEEMILRRVDLRSGESSSYIRLLPSPSVIKSITFDPDEPDRVLAAGEGGIVQSLDNGQTWTSLLGDVDHRFYYQVALDPQDPDVIYTAGWNKVFDEPQPLILEVSGDRGATWVEHQLNDPALFGGVWSILAVTENDRTVLYLGLQRGGIFRVIPPSAQ